MVRLRLTEQGAAALEKLTALHLEELSRLATGLGPIWQGHLDPQPPPIGEPPGGGGAGRIP